MPTNYKPDFLPNVVPYLVVADAEKELVFIKEVLAAKEMRLTRDPLGRVGHGELKIGDSVIMLAQASEGWPASPATLYIYVPDVDAVYGKAIAAGAASIWAPADQPYGDRNAGVKDANGVQWWLATHLEEVSEDQAEARAKESSKLAVST
jgi:PhnB protein